MSAAELGYRPFETNFAEGPCPPEQTRDLEVDEEPIEGNQCRAIGFRQAETARVGAKT